MNENQKSYYDWHWLMIFIVSAVFVLSTIIYMSWIFNEQKIKLDFEAKQHIKVLTDIEERIKNQEIQIKKLNIEVQVAQKLLNELKNINEKYLQHNKGN